MIDVSCFRVRNCQIKCFIIYVTHLKVFALSYLSEAIGISYELILYEQMCLLNDTIDDIFVFL